MEKLNPPQFEKETKLFSYDAGKFAKTISKLTPALLSQIQICVWRLDPTQKSGCTNILESTLTGEAFDALVSQAAYTTYTGTLPDLRAIGVV